MRFQIFRQSTTRTSAASGRGPRTTACRITYHPRHVKLTSSCDMSQGGYGISARISTDINHPSRKFERNSADGSGNEHEMSRQKSPSRKGLKSHAVASSETTGRSFPGNRLFARPSWSSEMMTHPTYSQNLRTDPLSRQDTFPYTDQSVVSWVFRKNATRLHDGVTFTGGSTSTFPPS